MCFLKHKQLLLVRCSLSEVYIFLLASGPLWFTSHITGHSLSVPLTISSSVQHPRYQSREDFLSSLLGSHVSHITWSDSVLPS